MAFRADESAKDGYEQALRYLVPREYTGADRTRSEHAVADIVDMCGNVIDTYPTWHPLMAANENDRIPVTTPRKECGYNGLDHTICFVNGFVTCPYGDGQDVIDSVENLPYCHAANISAERLDVKLYNPTATPILVRCEWNDPLPMDGMIPKSLAVPLLLEQELPCWHWSQVAETWETMRSYFLGSPHGSRSSLFVNQETGQTIKNIWNSLIYTGMFGPIKV